MKNNKTKSVSYIKDWWAVGAVSVAVFGAAMWFGSALSPQSGGKTSIPDELVAALKTQKTYQGNSLTGHYLASRFAASQQDMAASAKYMSEAMQYDSSNKALMTESLRMMVMSGQIEQAVSVATRLLDSGSADPMAALIVMVHEVKSGRFEKAEALMDLPDDSGLYFVIKPVLKKWVALGQIAHPTKPVSLQQTIDQAGFLAPFIEYQQALMNDVAGHQAEALAGYLRSANNPDAMPYRLVQALSNYHLRMGSKQKAQEVYDRYSLQNPTSELIPETLPQGDKAAADVTPMVETPAQGMAEILFTTASLLFGEQITNESMVYLQLALHLRPDFPPAQMMVANLHEQMGNHEQAIAVYEAIDKDTIFYKRGLVRTALNYEAMKEKDKAVRMLKQLAEANPTDEEPLVSLGDLYRSEKEYRRAIEQYDRAIERVSAPKPQHWSLFYARGICYEREGEWDKAEADFKQALALEIDQPDVLNYLGYSWLIQNQNVAQAKSYIEKAMNQRPGDAHIIDSMGWAHYLLGEFDEAIIFLEQAAEITPQDPTINEHLGDAYWRAGRRIEAHFQWERALVLKTEDEKAVRQKLQAGMADFEPLMAETKTKGEPLAEASPTSTIAKEQPVVAE